MIPVHLSPRNPQRTNLTLQENGKAINLEVDEEESEKILVDEEDLEMEVETQVANPITSLPEYVPLRKGKAKALKDIFESKRSLQTPLLSDDIIFEGSHLRWVHVLKFEDWDLANHEKIPHFVTEKLMRRQIDATAGTIELEPQTWLNGVEKAGLLNLL